MVEFEIKDGIAIIPEGTTVIAESAFEGRSKIIKVWKNPFARSMRRTKVKKL